MTLKIYDTFRLVYSALCREQRHLTGALNRMTHLGAVNLGDRYGGTTSFGDIIADLSAL